jgi:hypothetical protein
MDWKRAIWNRSLVARILLALLLAMVPLYLIGIGIYSWGIGAVQSEIVNSKTQQTSAYLSSLETKSGEPAARIGPPVHRPGGDPVDGFCPDLEREVT